MIQTLRRTTRADRMRRGFPNWIVPTAGTIGLLATLIFAIVQK